VIAFRPATLADRPFVVATWSASYKRSHSAGIIQTEDWAGIMHGQIEKVLAREGMRAVIAYDKRDQDYLYGWIAGDTTASTPVVAYVYVKEPYRRQGIARGLFSAFGVDPKRHFLYPCKTGIVAKLSSKVPLAKFNNNEIRYPKEQP
jgi:GNAT superfamily N-acetyltransferase